MFRVPPFFLGRPESLSIDMLFCSILGCTHRRSCALFVGVSTPVRGGGGGDTEDVSFKKKDPSLQSPYWTAPLEMACGAIPAWSEELQIKIGDFDDAKLCEGRTNPDYIKCSKTLGSKKWKCDKSSPPQSD